MQSITEPILGEDRLVASRFIRPFSTIGNADVAIVGGKNASLGEMYAHLTPKGILVPNGFAVTADAYRYVVERNALAPLLHEALDGLDWAKPDDFTKRAHRAHRALAHAEIPDDLREEILGAYRSLRAQYGDSMSVAVRSSATAEDLPNASFAGQHESFVNVAGEDLLLEAYRQALASLFLERAIHYRIDGGFDHFRIALSVGVMKMVRSDRAASGVAFTLDTESGFRGVTFITGSYGLGENIVSGAVDPDEFYVFKATLEKGFRRVLRHRLGDKARMLVFAPGDQLRGTTIDLETPNAARGRYCLTDDEVLTIAEQCAVVERHYSELAGHPTPMDIEWAKDGIDGRIYLVQARPETVASQRDVRRIDEYHIHAAGTPLASGRAVGNGVAVGTVRIVASRADLAAFRPGEVLVSQTTTPDWEPVMKDAAAIVTDRGGRTCHAAIVARELGIPAIVGTGNATSTLQSGATVTVSCASGAEGAVYAGRVPFEVERIDIGTLAKPPTAVMLTLADPDKAFSRAMLPNDGVGLARIEFIVADEIGIHPMALAHPERVTESAATEAIRQRTAPYESPSEFFISKLAEGVATIAAAVYPKPAIVRMSDFKSDEYAQLIGGSAFEPAEANPMLGLRGASRYTHPIYADGFALECAAMRRVREEMGFENVILMIPFCRRTDEADLVLKQMAEHGLRRGEGGLQIYVMCEIPNNVIQIDAFATRFDGFSIGSNDLTQLVLGVDRDSELLAAEFDERDPGVMEMLRQTVVGAKRNGRYVGICGQAPSDYPELAAYLVGLGIDSISLNPDSVVQTIRRLSKDGAKRS